MGLESIIKYCITSILILSCCGCTEKAQNVSENPIGEYVYFDQYKCLHVEGRCLKLTLTEDGVKPNFMVTRIPTIELRYLENTCASCVTDKIYKDLEEIVESNNEKEDSISVE